MQVLRKAVHQKAQQGNVLLRQVQEERLEGPEGKVPGKKEAENKAENNHSRRIQEIQSWKLWDKCERTQKGHVFTGAHSNTK